MSIILFERFSKIVRKLHTRRTCSYRVLRMIAFITLALDIPRDLGIILVFIGENSTLSDVCALLELSIDYNWSVTNVSSTSTTLVSIWCKKASSSTTIMAKLRCFVRENYLVQPGYAWQLLSMHSLKMNAFKPRRMTGITLVILYFCCFYCSSCLFSLVSPIFVMFGDFFLGRLANTSIVIGSWWDVDLWNPCLACWFALQL